MLVDSTPLLLTFITILTVSDYVKYSPVCYVILVDESRVESAMKEKWLELPRDENQKALFDSDAELFMYSAGLV